MSLSEADMLRECLSEARAEIKRLRGVVAKQADEAAKVVAPFSMTADELARALDGTVEKLVFFLKARDGVEKRAAVLGQALREARAWLDVGNDFDLELVRVPAETAR